MAPAARLGFPGLILLGFIFTLAALLTPGWRMFTGDGAPSIGLATYYCGSGSKQVQNRDCSEWATQRQTFEKVCLGCLIVAVLIELVAVLLALAVFSKGRYQLAAPGASLCGLAALLLLITVIVYGVKFDSKTVYMQSLTYEMIHNAHLGYSFYLTIIAFLLVLLAAMAGGALKGQHITNTEIIH